MQKTSHAWKYAGSNVIRNEADELHLVGHAEPGCEPLKFLGHWPMPADPHLGIDTLHRSYQDIEALVVDMTTHRKDQRAVAAFEQQLRMLRLPVVAEPQTPPRRCRRG